MRHSDYHEHVDGEQRLHLHPLTLFILGAICGACCAMLCTWGVIVWGGAL